MTTNSFSECSISSCILRFASNFPRMDARQTEFMKIDKELENTVGEKERAIGALRQHAEEQGCQ
jgi:hypothetical protein